MDEDTFYNSGYFAVLPMDFYFPGHGKSGDLPPRTGFAKNSWFEAEVVPDLKERIKTILGEKE